MAQKEEQREAQDSRQVVIVAFGDSTTAPREGLTVYPDLLQQEWRDRQQPVNVINSGVRGDHSDHAMARIEDDVLAHSPDIVILRFGINDSAIDVWQSPPATAARVPMARFRQNMITMVEMIRAKGGSVLICTPNPLSWSEITLPLYGKNPYLPDDPDGFNILLRAYVDVIRKLSEELALPLVDLDTAFRQHQSEVVPSWQSLLLDGMHPNDEGHRLAARLMLPQLDKMRAKLT